MLRILVVDDERSVGQVLVALLRQAGYEANHCSGAHAALAQARSESVDLVLTDLQMPQMDGMELLDALRAHDAELPVVMITAHGNVETAVEAMKRGARDYIQKPVERDELLHVVSKCVKQPERPPVRQPTAGELIGEAPAFQAALQAARRAAPAPSTVLVVGETGTGKERLARYVHEHSRRSGEAFVAINCGAIPEGLVEAELFGHVRGAFSGAVSDRPGRFVVANKGTLFLDEIGELSLAAQAKVLRAIQEREVQPVGSNELVKVDVRVIAATHRDLQLAVQAGEFREDLFYRLSVIPLQLPALRQRTGDIRLLARAFLDQLSPEIGRRISLNDAAMAVLEAHAWPGNVRELQNVIERLLVLCESATPSEADVKDAIHAFADSPQSGGPDLNPEDPGSVGEATGTPLPRSGGDLDEARSSAERAAIVHALAKTNGNRTQAARVLGVSRRTLYKKLADLQIV